MKDSFISINPVDGKQLFKTESWSENKILNQISLLNETFNKWKDFTIDQRIEFIKESKNNLQKNRVKFARWITLEVGKPIAQSISEVEKSISLFDYYIEIAKKTLDQKTITQPSFKEAKAIYQPLGIIFGVMPWNFPLWQVIRFALPTLLSGNVVLLKHAPNVSVCNNLIEAIFSSQTINPYKAAFVEIKDIETIVANKYVQGISLTGSEKAGSSLASLAGKHIKKSLLELGGSDAFIITKNTDLKKAIQSAVASRMINTGQTCISTKRLFIPEEFIEDAIPILNKEFSNYTFGDIHDKETSVGVLARPDLVESLFKQLALIEKLGAKLKYKIGEDKNNFVAPRWYFCSENVNTNFKEEIFGPVLQVFTYKNKNHLIELVNDTDFGLGCAIWSDKKQEAENLALQINAGSIAINTIVQSNAYLPFGGIKKSGYGRELGENSLLEFVNKKIIYSL